jgi:uncharacterized protein
VNSRITKDDILDFLKRRKPSYFKSYDLTQLGLIGSFSRGEAHGKSDIDLVVEFKAGTDNLFEKTESLRRSVKRKFNRKVDIATARYIKSYVKKNVLRDAIFV